MWGNLKNGTSESQHLCGSEIPRVYVYEAEEDQQLIEELLDALSYTGIGGKKSTGLGKFDFRRAKEADIKSLKEALERKRDWNMLLSSAFPQEDELENAMEGASYLLEKRSGFVASEDYADTFRRKRDMYVFAAGSCFKERFAGDIFEVSDGGRHPVYRYAKALFLGV